MRKDTLDIILVFVLLFAVMLVFIRIAVKIRRGGGSMTALMHGALDSFYNKEKRNAIEYTTEEKAGKKMKEQSSGKDVNQKQDL